MYFLIIAGALFVRAPAHAVDQIKTSETFVDSVVGSLTTHDKSFSLYIGDNLAGVTAPVKSAYFRISGVYTGSGTLQFQLNSTNSQTYTLPSVGTTPTPFEILYKDTSNVINPTSAGTYTYTLTATVTGVTVYSYGAVATVTHRYVPPSCGGSTNGDLTSAIFDTVPDGAAFNSIAWKGSLGTGKVRLKLATSDCTNGKTNPPTCNDAATWEFRGPDAGACSTNTTSDSDWYVASPDTPVAIGCAANHDDKRYFRYKIQLCANSDCVSTGATSPTVDDVIVSWSP